MFVCRIPGVSSEIFYDYLKAFSMHCPSDLKVVVIDNAGFHSLKDSTLPSNIKLLNTLPYSSELKPSEEVWVYIKQSFKNKLFKSLKDMQNWLHNFVREKLPPQVVKSISHDKLYLNAHFIR